MTRTTSHPRARKWPSAPLHRRVMTTRENYNRRRALSINMPCTDTKSGFRRLRVYNASCARASPRRSLIRVYNIWYITREPRYFTRFHTSVPRKVVVVRMWRFLVCVYTFERLPMRISLSCVETWKTVRGIGSRTCDCFFQLAAAAAATFFDAWDDRVCVCVCIMYSLTLQRWTCSVAGGIRVRTWNREKRESVKLWIDFRRLRNNE